MGVNPLSPFTRLSGNATTNGGAVDYTGYPLLFGTGYTASLWAAPVQPGILPPEFQLLATTPFRTAPATTPGFWQPIFTPVIVPFITEPGTPAQFQVRVWDNLNGTLLTWASALARSESATGVSDVIIVTPIFSPNLPAELLGLTSFNLTIVPEPTALTFGLLGTILAAAWCVRRR